MKKRTTIEIDQDLLEAAREALGQRTTRATVEEALRRAAHSRAEEMGSRAARQRRYLERLDRRVERAVLASNEMWR